MNLWDRAPSRRDLQGGVNVKTVPGFRALSRRRASLAFTLVGASAITCNGPFDMRLVVLLRNQVNAILYVMLELMDIDLLESAFLQIFSRSFTTPHGTKTFSIQRQRDRHTMHARNRVEEWS